MTGLIFVGLAVLAMAIAIFIAFRATSRPKKKTTHSSSKNKRFICSECIVGKRNFELDPGSTVCPYIYSCKNNSCSFFVPLHNKKNSTE